MDFERTVEAVRSWKRTLDDLLDNLDFKFREFLSEQQRQFEWGFQEQLATVQRGFDDMCRMVRGHLSKEAESKRVATLVKERNFFQDHALFLNERNEKQAEEIKRLQMKYELQKNEAKAYQQMYTELRKRSVFVPLADGQSENRSENCFLTQGNLKSGAIKAEPIVVEGRLGSVLRTLSRHTTPNIIPSTPTHREGNFKIRMGPAVRHWQPS